MRQKFDDLGRSAIIFMFRKKVRNFCSCPADNSCVRVKTIKTGGGKYDRFRRSKKGASPMQRRRPCGQYSERAGFCDAERAVERGRVENPSASLEKYEGMAGAGDSYARGVVTALEKIPAPSNPLLTRVPEEEIGEIFDRMKNYLDLEEIGENFDRMKNYLDLEERPKNRFIDIFETPPLLGTLQQAADERERADSSFRVGTLSDSEIERKEIAKRRGLPEDASWGDITAHDTENLRREAAKRRGLPGNATLEEIFKYDRTHPPK